MWLRDFEAAANNSMLDKSIWLLKRLGLYSQHFIFIVNCKQAQKVVCCHWQAFPVKFYVTCEYSLRGLYSQHFIFIVTNEQAQKLECLLLESLFSQVLNTLAFWAD